MHCTICNHPDTKVIDSRISNNGLNIRRRRECLKCDYRFSTLEEVEILDLTIVKSDGRRETYNREKIESGLKKALEKRSITKERFRELVTKIERDIQKKKKREVTSRVIGDIVMNRLKSVDKVAYIRFVSVYSAFEDISKFQDALAGLGRSRRTKGN